jgi:hypothetical protein
MSAPKGSAHWTGKLEDAPLGATVDLVVKGVTTTFEVVSRENGELRLKQLGAS